jgi:hypothetical protein
MEVSFRACAFCVREKSNNEGLDFKVFFQQNFRDIFKQNIIEMSLCFFCREFVNFKMNYGTFFLFTYVLLVVENYLHGSETTSCPFNMSLIAIGVHRFEQSYAISRFRHILSIDDLKYQTNH